MIRYTSNSHKKISIFFDSREVVLYPGECFENNPCLEKNGIVETEKSHPLTIVQWIGLFFRCLFSTLFKIFIMDISTSWIENVDPFYVRTVEAYKINSSVTYSKSAFGKDGRFLRLPTLAIDEKEVNIMIFVDWGHLKREFLIRCFELCHLTFISEFLISLVFFFSGKYSLFLLMIYMTLSAVVIVPVIFKVFKLYRQYVFILKSLRHID